MKWVNRKYLSIVLTVCMLVTMLPVMTTTAKAVGPTRTTQLDLTATQVTYQSVDYGEVTVDPSSGNIKDTVEGWAWYKFNDGDYTAPTLVLEGFDFQPSNSDFEVDTGALVVPANTTIVIKGENYITCSSITSSHYGIDAKDSLTIKGASQSDSLTITAGNISGGASIGLAILGSLTIDGGAVEFNAGGAGNSYGISIDANVSEVTVKNSGSLTANGGAAVQRSYGLYASDHSGISVSVDSTSAFTATGGTFSNGFGSSSGIASDGGLTVSGGAISTKGVTSAILTRGVLTYAPNTKTFKGKDSTDAYTIASALSTGLIMKLVQASDTSTAILDAKLVDASDPLPPHDTPAILINYVDEELFNFVSGGLYSFDGGTTSQTITGTTLKLSSKSGWLNDTTNTDLSIVRKGDDTHSESAAQTLVIGHRPAAPTTPAGVAQTASGANDGKITSVDTTMQYKKAADETWTNCADTQVTGLEPGAYHVRYKAVPILAGLVRSRAPGDPAFASTTKNVTIATASSGGTPATYPVLSVSGVSFGAQHVGYQARPAAESIVIVNTGDAAASISSVSVSPNTAFEISGSGSSVAVGGSISTWKIQPKLGLEKGNYTGTITVSYNGRTASASVSFSVVDSNAPVADPTAEPIRAIQASSDQEVELILKVLQFTGERYPVTIKIIDQDGKVWLVKDGVVIAATEEQKEATEKSIAVLAPVKKRAAGNVDFKLTPKELSQLPEGEYTLWLSSKGNVQNQAMPETKVGTLIITGRTTWSVPEAFTATAGIGYQLVTKKADDASVVTVNTNKPETIGIDGNGVITGKLRERPEDNVATVAFEDEKGNTKTCVVTVVPNRYARQLPLRLSGRQGVFSSTKLLSYNGKNLEAETFLLNKRKNKTMYKAGKLTLVIYKGSAPIFKKELSTWRMTKALRYNGRAIYKVTITPEELKKYGAPEGVWDLASGAYQVVLTRPSNVTPVLGNEANIIVQKGIEMRDMVIRSSGRFTEMPQVEDNMN